MSLFTPNIEISDYYTKARYLLAWRISILFFIVFIVLLLAYGVNYPSMNYVLGFLIILSVGSLVYLKTSVNTKPLYWIYAIGGGLIVHIGLNTVLELIHYVDFIWILVTILIAYIGLGKKIGGYFVLVHGIGIAYFLFFSLNMHIELIDTRSYDQLIGAYVEIWLSLFAFTYLLHQYFRYNDHLQDELQLANQKLLIQNQENIVLLKEVHHRVKNNLQIITSLLRIQKHELKHDEEAVIFDEAINRIMSMSLIHQKLYHGETLSRINLKSYLTELCDEIVQVYSSDKQVKIDIHSELESVDMKIIVPLGLLITELVSNSFKHAFTNKTEGYILIDIKNDEADYFQIKYDDFGKWVDDGVNNLKFGVELIHTLTEQLDGTIERKGTSYVLQLKDVNKIVVS